MPISDYGLTMAIFAPRFYRPGHTYFPTYLPQCHAPSPFHSISNDWRQASPRCRQRRREAAPNITTLVPGSKSRIAINELMILLAPRRHYFLLKKFFASQPPLKIILNRRGFFRRGRWRAATSATLAAVCRREYLPSDDTYHADAMVSRTFRHGAGTADAWPACRHDVDDNSRSRGHQHAGWFVSAAFCHQQQPSTSGLQLQAVYHNATIIESMPHDYASDAADDVS